MTFYDGSHDYHPCEYDFDALWSQFEEQKDNDEHAATSCSSVEVAQPLIPQPSQQQLSLVVPQPPHVSQSTTFVEECSSSVKAPLSSPPKQQPEQPLHHLTTIPQKQEPALWSQFEEQKDNAEHAEASRSSIGLSHILHPHQLSMAPWPTLPPPTALPPFLPIEKYSSPDDSCPLHLQQLPQAFFHQQHGLPLVSWSLPQQQQQLSQSSTTEEYSMSPEVPRLRRPHRSQQQPRRRLKRKAPKQEPLDDNVTFPTGFERVLEKASTNENHIVDGEWEPPRRRDCRRCETKVMLQTADGQLFNKYFEEEDIRDFARRFKTLRCEYGFSQADVGAALGRRYGSDFSQTTISRFEGLVLSHSNMCKLRPPVEQWIVDIQSAIETGISLDQLRRACKNGDFWPSDQHQQADSDTPINSNLVPPLRKRRKRTSLDASQRLALDSYFDVNQRPDNAQMADIAKTLELEFEVVRVWFCNRRQKTRKSIPKIKNEIDSDTTSSPIN